jgi:hypothetical protein
VQLVVPPTMQTILNHPLFSLQVLFPDPAEALPALPVGINRLTLVQVANGGVPEILHQEAHDVLSLSFVETASGIVDWHSFIHTSEYPVSDLQTVAQNAFLQFSWNFVPHIGRNGGCDHLPGPEMAVEMGDASIHRNHLMTQRAWTFGRHSFG